MAWERERDGDVQPRNDALHQRNSFRDLSKRALAERLPPHLSLIFVYAINFASPVFTLSVTFVWIISIISRLYRYLLSRVDVRLIFKKPCYWSPWKVEISFARTNVRIERFFDVRTFISFSSQGRWNGKVERSIENYATRLFSPSCDFSRA